MSYELVAGSEANLKPKHHESTPHPVADNEDNHGESRFARSSDSVDNSQSDAAAAYPSAKAEHPTKQPAKLLNTVYGRWLAEICACFVSLLALAAIAITLGTHDGRPLPNWPFRISVNALISVFAVILKATLMIPVTEAVSQLKWSWYNEAHPLHDIARFDNASRGLWGSIKLIQSLHARNIGSLGAAITILAVASDPFIQQVINYHSCPQPEINEAASIVRTNNYTNSGIHTGAGTSSLDLPMQAAIYQGAYGSFSNISASCGTGNCTFPLYRTVGMCSTCQDISASINKTCVTMEDLEGGKACNWTLPSGMALQIPNITTMYMGPSSEVYPYGNYNLTSFSTTQILSFAGDYLYGTDMPADEWKTLAAECSLSPCVRTYQVNVTQGISSEVLLSTTPMEKASDYPGASYTATPMPCLINGTPYPATAFTTANATNTFPVTGLLPNSATAHLPKECYFLYASPLGLQQFLPSFLTGTVDAAPEVDASDPAWLGTLWADGNVSLAIVGAAWASLADSMTANMRRNGDASNSAPAAGVALRTETCISVRWAWLAFPAALLLLTVVFLVVTIVESAGRAPGRVWKGSPLALLFHGLDGEVGERYGAVGRVEEMEAVAKRVRVRMGDEGRGLKLVEVKEHPV